MTPDHTFPANSTQMLDSLASLAWLGLLLALIVLVVGAAVLLLAARRRQPDPISQTALASITTKGPEDADA